MPDWLDALLLGLIEGLTEFIPVSSTGHLIIFESLTNSRRPDAFIVFIQCGAALALLPVFWKRIFSMTSGRGGPAERAYMLKLMLAFLITAAGGLVLDVLDFKLPDNATPVAWATIIGAFVIFAIERWTKNHQTFDHVTWRLAVIFAGAQLLAAVFPGCSRSGATIMFAMACGLARPAATEFSFLLGMPTLLAAGSYKLLKAIKDGELAGSDSMSLGIGFLAAGVSAFLVVKWLLRFVQTHTFNGFAVYRLLLGIALLVWIAYGPTPASAGRKAADPIPPAKSVLSSS
ncbi:MAG: undecaprenyl-diphosphate phosphatase [Verrucomicrobiales bacterium]